MLHIVECVFQPDDLSRWKGGEGESKDCEGRNGGEGGMGGRVFNMEKVYVYLNE